MESTEKYVSIFKIDGVPILPPLMNKKRREEMKSYKDLAVALETKLKLERETKICNSPITNDTDRSSDTTIITTTTFEDEYLEELNLIKSPTKIKLESEQKMEKNIKCLGRSDIFICDITSNMLTIPCSGNHINIKNEMNSPVTLIDEITKNELTINLDEKTSTSKIEEETGFIEQKKFSEIHSTLSFSDVKVESNECSQEISSVLVESANMSKTTNRTQNFNEDQNSNMHKNLNLGKQPITSLDNGENQASIIRSNSFTLDVPSDVLIKHIVKCKTEELHKAIPQPKIQKYEKNFLVKVSNEEMPENRNDKRNLNRMIKNGQKIETKTNSNLILKTKKSPYDFKTNGKSSKLLRKHKNQLTKSSSITSIKRKNNSPLRNQKDLSVMEIRNTENNNFHHVKKMIEEIENKHRLQLDELLEKQQKEQKKMRENFEKQQALLVEKLTLSIVNKKNVPNEVIKSVWSDEISSLSPSSINKSSISSNYDNFDTNDSLKNTSPRRTVDAISVVRSSTARKREAATKINAFVRGYLTRRLFKTEYVKRIVQTIRDTLLFVIDLHMETKNDDNEINIKLKARLLQQLTSAYQNLYKVFLEYNIKERMEIIAKDRKLLKSKINKYQG